MDPGLAVHRFALRRIRGTSPLDPKDPEFINPLETIIGDQWRPLSIWGRP